jgi:acyl-CoA synthetase (AMP-forming)/AMP-acid ligase II
VTRRRHFYWNNTEHLEAYFAVPRMGAVLHALNIRLPGAQVAGIIRHAGTGSSSWTTQSAAFR